MGKGSYNGGSTTIGAGSRGWYGTGGPTEKLPINSGKTSGKRARDAAIARHRMALRLDRYAALAEALRQEGFSESEIKRGLQIQRAKDLNAEQQAGKDELSS